MFWELSFATALILSSVAGYFDLKTTEIPNKLSLGMIVLGLSINVIHSLVSYNPSFILNSASVGAAFFTFGFLMYIGGQWGGGDAKVLTGIGTLLPSVPTYILISQFSFPILFLINMFVVGAVYIIIYAFFIGMRNVDVWNGFESEIKGEWKKILVFFSISVVSVVSVLFVLRITHLLDLFLLMMFAIFVLFILFKYLRTVEDTAFELEISTEKLEVGDMLAESVEGLNPEEDDGFDPLPVFMSTFILLPLVMVSINYTNIYLFYAFFSGVIGLGIGLVYSVSYFLGLGVFEDSSDEVLRGLKEDEVKDIKEKRDEVKIREGVRFSPVFPISLIVSVYLGNLLIYII